MSVYEDVKKALEAGLAPSIAQIKDDTAAMKADIAIIKAELKTTNGRFDDLIERMQLRKEIEELKRQVKARKAS
jgi:hypothetical protein